MSPVTIGSDGHAANSSRLATDWEDLRAIAPILPRHGWYLHCKAVVDCILAVTLLIALLPVIVVAAILVRITSAGPAFYSQTRLGRNRREFRIFKLRTMIHNAEAGTGAVWCKQHDSRVTPLGHFLRTTHIDEFPQLINVILGQMSLVGPRPERPEFIIKLDWEIPEYCERLSVKPGVTGLAQLALPPDSDVNSVRRKLVYDLYYVRQVSPWLDVLILFHTATQLLRAVLTRAFRALALPDRTQVLETVEQQLPPDSQLVAASELRIDERNA